MSNRIVGRTRIVKDKETGEYVVKAFDQHGKRFEEADYFTTDRADAEATARLMVKPTNPESK